MIDFLASGGCDCAAVLLSCVFHPFTSSQPHVFELNFQGGTPKEKSLNVKFCSLMKSGSIGPLRTIGEGHVPESRPQSHEMTPREGRKNDNSGGRKKKKSDILGPLPFWSPRPTLLPPHPPPWRGLNIQKRSFSLTI